MSLSYHVNESEGKREKLAQLARFIEINNEIPKYELPNEPMTSQAASSIIRSELKLDGNPELNLASFVTTDVDEECRQLMLENSNKNLVDTSQYVHTSEIQERCINILANLFHAPHNEQGAVGTATIGSSEAIMLAGLAMKWRWREKQNKSITAQCNLIFSAAVHVSVLKLCRYFDIEPRIIPLEHNRFTLDIDQVLAQCDENTCGVLAILGTTLTGEFDNIKQLNQGLLKLKQEKNLDIPIHVDGASGAMIAPFLFPELQWDFRLEQVRSINTSGHKYGLVLPGLGWVIWRSKQDLPEDLIFHVNYLGTDEATFNLNFSRSASNVIGQYYQFLRLGFQGYKNIMQLSINNAKYLADCLSSSFDENLFIIRSQHNQPALPMVVFSLNPKKNLKFDEIILVHRLKERGWIVPAYTLAANANDITVCRIVVRETFTHNFALLLLEDIRRVLINLAQQYGHDDLVECLQSTNHRRTNHSRRQANTQKKKATVHVIC